MNKQSKTLLVLAVVGTLLVVVLAGPVPALRDDGGDSDDSEASDDGTSSVSVEQGTVIVQSGSIVAESASAAGSSVDLNSTQVVEVDGEPCRISVTANESGTTVTTCDAIDEEDVTVEDDAISIQNEDVNVVVQSERDEDGVSVSVQSNQSASDSSIVVQSNQASSDSSVVQSNSNVDVDVGVSNDSERDG